RSGIRHPRRRDHGSRRRRRDRAGRLVESVLRRRARRVPDQLFASAALLLGRITFEGFAAAWPSMEETEGEFAVRMNPLPKFVASTTLREPLAWNGSLLEGDVAAEVAKLKKQPGRDLLIYGSGELVNTLHSRGSIDEYRLMIFPVTLGVGKHLFREGPEKRDLTLSEARTTGSGGALLTYHTTRDSGTEP